MNEKEKNLHENHRERMREKYRKGRDAMLDHELLELVLFTPLRRVNTNPLAHTLIRHFGSLERVLNAEEGELLQVEGVGPETAFFLSQLSYLVQRSAMNTARSVKLDSFTALAEHLVPYFRGKTKEAVYLLMLDSGARLIDCCKLFEGSVNSCLTQARRIAEMALSRGATRIVLAHNHPSGELSPSGDDIVCARFLRRIFHHIDLKLVEFFIISGEAYLPVLYYLKKEHNDREFEEMLANTPR